MNQEAKRKVKEGEKYEDSRGTIKVMAVVDGYVMARRPRCTPFVRDVEGFLQDITNN